MIASSSNRTTPAHPVDAFADPVTVVLQAWAAIVPPQRVSVSAYAAEHRYLDNPGGGYTGRWSHDMVPYLVGIMDALSDREHDTVAVIGPGQSGKTAVAENWVLWSVAADPGSLLWYMPTDKLIEAYVKDRIDPMIESHAVLRGALGDRPTDSSLHFKRFGRMKVQFLAANTTNLISKSAPRIYADEIDAYDAGIGNVKDLLDVRRQTFGSESKLLASSHPDRAGGLDPKHWTAGIMQLYADSDRRRWYWACPQCGGYSTPCPGGEPFMPLHYEDAGTLDEVAASARLICPHCGYPVENGERYGMNLTGKWVAEGQTLTRSGVLDGTPIPSQTAGFWVVGVMSPFLKDGIGGLARARVKAERDLETTQSDHTLREVIVKQWGIPYSRRRRGAATVDAAALAERAEHLPWRQVPDGARYLIGAADIQRGAFEVLVRAFGIGRESWIIDRFVLTGSAGRPIDPATRPEDWDLLEPALLTRRYPLAGDPARGMSLRCVLWDSGGEPGVSDQAYQAWRRWRKAKLIGRHGKLNGHDLWSAVPAKGLATLGAPKLRLAYPETTGARGDVPLLEFNPSLVKDDVAGRLSRVEAGPGYIHFPVTLRDPEPPHSFFEQVCAETRSAAGRWEKIRPEARNEALDQLVMTDVGASWWGAARIDWKAPPPWAAEWDRNPLVGPMPAGDSTAPVPAALPQQASPPGRPSPDPLPPSPSIAAPAARPPSLADRLAALNRRS